MEDVQGEADILRAHLGRGKDGDVAAAVVSAYRAVAERISTDPALYEAVRVLGARLEQDEAMGADNVVSSAYATFAARLSETDARLEVAALRASLAKDLEGFSQAENLWKAYAVVVPRLAEADTKAELAILSAQWKTGGVELDSEWVTGYGALADHVKDAATVKACITFLRSQLMADELVPRIEREKVTPAYARLASHLIPAEAKSEAKLWRTYLGDERHRWSGGFPETAYAAVAQRLDDPAEVRAAAAALRMSLERELIAHDDPHPGNSNFRKRPYLSVPVSGEFVLAYSSVVALLDDAGVKAEANALRERLQQERKAEVLSSLVQAFKSVAVRLVETQDLKMAAAVLKARLGQETDIETAGGLALAYAKTAIAMNDAFELKSAAAILRVRLEQEAAASAAPSADAIRQRRRQLREDQPSLDGFVQAYATVAGRLPDADVKLEASALRARLEREDDGRIAGILATAYGAVAARLGEPAVQEAATYLRVHMERTAYGEITTQLAQAYAQVIGPVLARANAEAGVAITKEVLTLAGHPYLDDRSVLLALLKPAAKKNFGNDVASAVAWAQATYAIRAGNLRPPVRQETEAKGGRVPGDKPGS